MVVTLMLTLIAQSSSMRHFSGHVIADPDGGEELLTKQSASALLRARLGLVSCNRLFLSLGGRQPLASEIGSWEGIQGPEPLSGASWPALTTICYRVGHGRAHNRV
jgi:hypothetical protein